MLQETSSSSHKSHLHSWMCFSWAYYPHTHTHTLTSYICLKKNSSCQFFSVTAVQKTVLEDPAQTAVSAPYPYICKTSFLFTQNWLQVLNSGLFCDSFPQDIILHSWQDAWQSVCFHHPEPAEWDAGVPRIPLCQTESGECLMLSYAGVQTCHLSAKFAVFTLKWVIHVNRVDL